MSIQGLTNGPVLGSRRQEIRPGGTAGPSFREQLAERFLSSAESVSPTLYDAQIAMLEKMKQGKEKKEEEDAWDELMEYVDAWIATLRDEGDIEKSARACAAVSARAAEAERPAKRIRSEDVLLQALTERLYNG